MKFLPGKAKLQELSFRDEVLALPIKKGKWHKDFEAKASELAIMLAKADFPPETLGIFMEYIPYPPKCRLGGSPELRQDLLAMLAARLQHEICDAAHLAGSQSRVKAIVLNEVNRIVDGELVRRCGLPPGRIFHI